MEPINLYFSFVEEDEKYLKDLETSFEMLRKSDGLYDWSCKKLIPGSDREEITKEKIQESDIILLLVSSDFLASKYHFNVEVQQAMKMHAERKATVIPIIVRHCDWRHESSPIRNLQPLPKGGHPISQVEEKDGIYNEITQELKQIIKTIREKKEHNLIKNVLSTNAGINILNDYPKPNPLFTGREQELSEFERSLDKFSIIVVEGLGGIGKTEFMAKYIEQFVAGKDKILWLNGSRESKFEVFVQNAGYGDLLKGENKSLLAIFSGFKSLIERDGKMIFLDNFQTLDPVFSDFVAFAKQLENGKIILITKSEPIIPEKIFHIIRLEGLDLDAVNYGTKLRDNHLQQYKHITEKDIEIICKSTAGHPLAMQLAFQLMRYGLPADKIVATIIQYPERKEIESLTKRLFTDMYTHPSTSEKEKELLQKFAVFKEKVGRPAIDYIMGGEDVTIPLFGLIDKLLISYNEYQYETHPLIREFSYELMSHKIETHALAAEYYIGQRNRQMQVSLEEQIYFHLERSNQWDRMETEIEHNGRELIKIGQLSLVKELLDNLKKIGIEKPIFNILYGDIAQISGKWDIAKQHFDLASNQNTDKKVKAEGIIKSGEIFFRKGLAKNALPLFQQAYQFSIDNNLPKEEGRALNDIGLVKSSFGDSSGAVISLREALKIRDSVSDQRGVAETMNNIAGILRKQGNWMEAEELYYQCLKINEEIENKSGMAGAIRDLGNMLVHRGDFEKGLAMITESLELEKRVGNKSGIAASLAILAVSLHDKGDINSALKNYKQSLQINEEIGDNTEIAALLGLVGSAYKDKNRLDEALKMHYQSLEISKGLENKNLIASALSEIGVVLWRKGKFAEALENQNEAFRIYEELGNKMGVSSALSDISTIFYSQGKLDEALSAGMKSLQLKDELAVLIGKANVLHNIGCIYAKKEQYNSAIEMLLQSLSIKTQTEMIDTDTINWLISLRDEILGIEEFRKICKLEFSKLTKDVQIHIPISELCKEPIKSEPRLGRNDPCYCGSGRKFKQCHGKSK